MAECGGLEVRQIEAFTPLARGHGRAGKRR
jgi:hypothetical protein